MQGDAIAMVLARSVLRQDGPRAMRLVMLPMTNTICLLIAWAPSTGAQSVCRKIRDKHSFLVCSCAARFPEERNRAEEKSDPSPDWGRPSGADPRQAHEETPVGKSLAMGGASRAIHPSLRNLAPPAFRQPREDDQWPQHQTSNHPHQGSSHRRRQRPPHRLVQCPRRPPDK